MHCEDFGPEFGGESDVHLFQEGVMAEEGGRVTTQWATEEHPEFKEQRC